MKYCDCCQMRLPDSWTLPTDSEHLKEIRRLRAELAEYKLSLGTIHAMAHRVSAWTIRRECERAMPELAALAAKEE